MAADLFGDADDPLAEWADRPAGPGPQGTPAQRPPADEAPTESIPRAARVDDTAVLPQPVDAPVQQVPGGRPAAREAPPRPARTFPVGATLALLGALAVLFSALLQWAPDADRAVGAGFPRDIAFRRLLDVDPIAPTVSLGLVLLVAGIAGALVALLTMVVPALKFLRRLVGLASLALPVLFAFPVVPAFTDIGRLPELLGVGVYVAAAGGLVQVVAGRWFRR